MVNMESQEAVGQQGGALPALLASESLPCGMVAEQVGVAAVRREH